MKRNCHQTTLNAIFIFLNRTMLVLSILSTAVSCSDKDNDDNTTADLEPSDDGTSGASGSSGISGSSDSAGSYDEPTPPAAEDKAEICRCMLDWKVLPNEFFIPICEENIDDYCAECVMDELSAASVDSCSEVSSDDIDVSLCSIDCQDTIPPPETTEACKEMVANGQDNPAPVEETDCMCEKCLDVFAACVVNPDCLAILQCCGEAGAAGMDCYVSDAGDAGPCRDLIDAVLNTDPDVAMSMTPAVGDCWAANGCDRFRSNTNE